MKIHLPTLPLIFFLGLVLGIVSSCEKLDEDVIASKALVGTWRTNGNTVDITVEGVDFIEYLTTNFGYTEEEAQDISDAIVQEYLGFNVKSITFYGNKTYVLVRTDGNEEEGNWSVSLDGKTLNLVFDDVETPLSIIKQTSTDLLLQLPTIYDDVDFDNDGDKESEIEINSTLSLFVTSKGGMGY